MVIFMSDVYNACVQNVREMTKQRKLLIRLLNNALKTGNTYEEEALTKIFALLYSAYVESAFMKTINTPCGFNKSYIEQIMRCSNLESKWTECIDLAFSKIENANNKGEIANKKQTIKRLMTKYIIEPSQIRNKIAHGQLKVALNSDCTRVNNDTTALLNKLDFVEIDKLFEIYDQFSQCIEDLIESPYKAHYLYFYPRLCNLQNYIEETENYNRESKKKSLRESNKYINQKARNTQLSNI